MSQEQLTKEDAVIYMRTPGADRMRRGDARDAKIMRDRVCDRLGVERGAEVSREIERALCAGRNQESQSFVIQNPDNGLIWSARDKRCVSLRGDFSTYTSKVKAESAIRRTNALKHRGMVVAQIKFTHGMAFTEVV